MKAAAAKVLWSERFYRSIRRRSGEVIFEGHEHFGIEGMKSLRQNRRKIQMVFQDPTAAFNPKMRVKDILCEPLLEFWVAEKF